MSTAITEFRIEVPQADLDDLHHRLARTRWLDREPVADWSQGVPTQDLVELCRAWRDDYDWRATETRLNRIPQFRTEIEGVPVHFLHLRSSSPDAVPVVLTHGWPGSFLEFERVAALLTEPLAGRPAFDVVIPSLPGYGFSGRPGTTGWDIHRIARAWCELMARLGYPRFLAGGSDWGSSISTSIAMQQPDRLVGLHLVPPLVPADRLADDLTDAERTALADLDERNRDGSAYSEVHRTRPQTIGYALADSPVGLAAWIAEKLWSWADGTTGGLSRDQVLDDVSLYWLSGTAVSSTRLYWESIAEVARWFAPDAAGMVGSTIEVPTGCTVFPREVPRPSRRWAARRFTNIAHWSEPDRGGHFGAWEQPEVFASDLRATVEAIARS